MNLHPKCFAKSRPSVACNSISIYKVTSEDCNSPTIHSDLSLILEVAFVCYYDDGEGVLVLHSEDLLVECADLLE
jgi:hypothetical protein